MLYSENTFIPYDISHAFMWRQAYYYNDINLYLIPAYQKTHSSILYTLFYFEMISIRPYDVEGWG